MGDDPGPVFIAGCAAHGHTVERGALPGRAVAALRLAVAVTLMVAASGCGLRLSVTTGTDDAARYDRTGPGGVRQGDGREPIEDASVAAFSLAAAELPGDWLLIHEQVLPWSVVAAASTCLPEQPPAAQTDSWHGDFLFERAAEDYRTGQLGVTTARFLDRSGDGVQTNLSRYRDPAFLPCLTAIRGSEELGATEGQSVLLERSVEGVESVWFRSTFVLKDRADPDIADTIYVMTDTTVVKLVLRLTVGEPTKLAETVLPIVLARLHGGQAVTTDAVTPTAGFLADLDVVPGSADERRLTRHDIDLFVLGAAPALVTPDCPLVSTDALAEAAPAVWQRWEPAFVQSQPYLDDVGVEHSESGLVCRWDRTAVTGGQLYVTVLASPNTFLPDTDAVLEAGPHGHLSDQSTWGHGWCNVRDAPDAMIRITAVGPVIAAEEMWTICDRILPEVRAAVLAG